MAIDDTMQSAWRDMQRKRDSENGEPRLRGSDDGGNTPPMSDRVTRLEVQMELMRDDTREIKADLKSAIGYLSVLPTKRDLDTWRWQWIATGAAIIAITVGGITGGLALIARFAG